MSSFKSNFGCEKKQVQDKFCISVARVSKIMYQTLKLYAVTAEVTELDKRKLSKGRRVSIAKRELSKGK